MNRSLALLLGLLAGAGLAHAQGVPPAAPPPPPSPAPATVAATPAAPALDFHAALTPYGTWRTLAPYGEVWLPREMPAGWRPYTTGRWVFADTVGWTWMADEPWGWAPFHYGRWTLDAALGWLWVPGDVWAPAWVAWRECDGFTGWAPLPPCAGWSVGVGLCLGNADLALALDEPCWSFVPLGSLCRAHIREVLLEPERARIVLHGSRLVQHTLFVENGRAVHRPVSVERIEKASGAPLTHVVLRDVDRPEALGSASAAAGEVAVFRPRAEPATHASRAPAAPRGAQHATPAAPARSMRSPSDSRDHGRREHEHDKADKDRPGPR